MCTECDNERDSDSFSCKKCNSLLLGMEVGAVKVAEDNDFATLKSLVDDVARWKLEFCKGQDTKVWTQSSAISDFKMVKIHTIFPNVSAQTLFDVLHDPSYRKVWDLHMIESIEIGYLNPNNDIGYYSISCPAPLKNRDFVLQRSWLDVGDEKLIINHSVFHKDYPQKKGFIRGVSHLTGFVIREHDQGCFVGYVTQTDPRGKLPPWLVNKVTQFFAPKMVKQLQRAAEGYNRWKMAQTDPQLKPWIYPEQTLMSPRIRIADCVDVYKGSTSSLKKKSLMNYE